MALALRLSTYLRRTSVSVNKTAAEAAAMKDINRAIAIKNELAARSQLRIGLSAIVDRSEDAVDEFDPHRARGKGRRATAAMGGKPDAR